MASDLTHRIAAIFPGSRVRRSWALTGGLSARMTALELAAPRPAAPELAAPDGETRRVIVRQPGAAALQRNPQAAADEYRRLQLVQALGLPGPAPLYLDEMGALCGAPCLVMAYVDGRPDFAPADAPAAARQMAAALARIHQADLAAVDPAWLPAPSGAPDDELGRPAEDVAAWFETDRIRAMLQSVSRLAPPPATAPAAKSAPGSAPGAHPTLLHGDFWPGNLLWRSGALAAVIDWEDACLGDPLQDFAIARLDLLWIYGRAAFDAFSAEYRARMAPDPARLPYWDLYAALRLARLAGPDLQGWAAFFQPFGRTDITPQAIREHYRDFLARAFDRIA